MINFKRVGTNYISIWRNYGNDESADWRKINIRVPLKSPFWNTFVCNFLIIKIRFLQRSTIYKWWYMELLKIKQTISEPTVFVSQLSVFFRLNNCATKGLNKLSCTFLQIHLSYIIYWLIHFHIKMFVCVHDSKLKI